MIQPERQSRFGIQEVIEQKPFENPATQSFFTKWCEINDSLVPQIIGRDEWEERCVNGILNKRLDGKQTLYIPADLQLWEMIGVMEAVDLDTFDAQPNHQDKAREKLLGVGKTFQNAGIYIAQRLDSITKGQEIARALVEEFYGYGQSLIGGKRHEEHERVEDIASHVLTEADLIVIDRFLAGDSLYEARRVKADEVLQKNTEHASVIDKNKKDEFYEAERRKTLVQFFRVSAKAFELENKSANGELRTHKIHLKPWQNAAPFYRSFIAKIEQALVHKIETPKKEFNAAIFRRGLEKLSSEMRERGWRHSVNSFFKKLGIDLNIEQRKLSESLNIESLKAELEAIRLSGTSIEISRKEREIADKIQKSVSTFPYQVHADNPSQILVTQYINCVGASMLGGALMQKAGLSYLVGDVPGHSVLFLVTSDGQVELRDMQNSPLFNNKKIINEMIVGSKKDGSPLTVADIVLFSKKPTSEGLSFVIKEQTKKDITRATKKPQKQSVTLLEPEYGQQMQLLNNTGLNLYSLGQNEEAIEAYQQAIAINPRSDISFLGLGDALRSLGRDIEALEAYQQAIAINPMRVTPYNDLGSIFLKFGHKEGDPKRKQEYYNQAIEAHRHAIVVDPTHCDSYNYLGITFYSLGRYNEAIEAYQQAIVIDPKRAISYNALGIALESVGRNKEAVLAYKKFVKLADEEIDENMINRAKKIIAEFQDK